MLLGSSGSIEQSIHADGTIQKHKAWLVAKGYSQQQGINFEKLFLRWHALKQ